MSNGNVFAVTSEQVGVVELTPGGRQQVVFNAQNVSGNSLEGRARIVVDMPAQQSWYTIQERVERRFDAQEVHQFIVEVAIPEDALEGRNSFALEVDSVERPDEDYGRSENVLVVVKKTAEKKNGIPWWVWLIVGVGVVIVGVVIALIVGRSRTVELGDLTGLTADSAAVVLDSLRLESSTTIQLVVGQDGVVIAQDPAPNEAAGDSTVEVETGSTVSLTVAQRALVMPPVEGSKITAALLTLTQRGFSNISVAGTMTLLADSTVSDQEPAAGDTIAASDPVRVTWRSPQRFTFEPIDIFAERVPNATWMQQFREARGNAERARISADLLNQ